MLETLSTTEITTILIAVCLLLAGAFICGKLFEGAYHTTMLSSMIA